MNLTLETRKPAPLTNAGYRELARAVPAIEIAAYWIDGDRAAGLVWSSRPQLAETGDTHWVPADVFARLSGVKIHGGQTIVYGTAAYAMADLRATWKEVRGET